MIGGRIGDGSKNRRRAGNETEDEISSAIIYTHRLRRDTRPASYLFSPFSPRFIRSTGGRVTCVRACVSSAQHRPTTRAIAPKEIAARVSSLETVKTFADPYGPRTKQKRKQREEGRGAVAVALPSIIGDPGLPGAPVIIARKIGND